jgi:hypothetical protein
MADEATIFAGLQIINGDWHVPAGVTNYTDDVSGIKGPVPGAIAVPVTGVNVDLSELTTPGWCKIYNLDTTNYVEYGGFDASTETFYPVGEIPAGKWIVFKLSRHLGSEYGTVGTAAGASGNYLRLRSPAGVGKAAVEAYEA